MSRTDTTWRRAPRRHRGSGALARRSAFALSLALLASAVALPALADGPKTYTATVATDSSSGEVCAKTSQRFTLTLTNTSGQQQLGSADITPGFEVSDVEVGASPVAAGPIDTIELRNLSVAPSRSVTVSFTAAPPVGAYPFDIVAKQANNFRGNPGNDLTLVGGTPTVTVSDTGDCAPATIQLEFLTQPGSAEVNRAIPGTTAATPQVQLLDGDGALLETDGIGITIGIGSTPSDGAALSGTTTVTTDTAGVASFPDLRIDTTGLGYTLEASAPGAEDDVLSDGFDVSDTLCAATETCRFTATKVGGLTPSASGVAGTDGGSLSLSTTAKAGPSTGCGAPDDLLLTRIPAEVTAIGVGLSGKLVEFRIDRKTDQQITNNGVAFYQVCAEPLPPFSASSSFVDRFGTTVVNPDDAVSLERLGLDEDDLDDTATSGFLPDCSGPDDAPCVVSRVKQGGSPIITVRWGSGFRFR